MPRQEGIFFGRALPFFFRGVSEQSGFPFPIKMLGMMYIMSFDLVRAIGGRSYKVRVCEEVITPAGFITGAVTFLRYTF